MPCEPPKLYDVTKLFGKILYSEIIRDKKSKLKKSWRKIYIMISHILQTFEVSNLNKIKAFELDLENGGNEKQKEIYIVLQIYIVMLGCS